MRMLMTWAKKVKPLLKPVSLFLRFWSWVIIGIRLMYPNCTAGQNTFPNSKPNECCKNCRDSSSPLKQI